MNNIKTQKNRKRKFSTNTNPTKSTAKQGRKNNRTSRFNDNDRNSPVNGTKFYSKAEKGKRKPFNGSKTEEVGKKAEKRSYKSKSGNSNGRTHRMEDFQDKIIQKSSFWRDEKIFNSEKKKKNNQEKQISKFSDKKETRKEKRTDNKQDIVIDVKKQAATDTVDKKKNGNKRKDKVNGNKKRDISNRPSGKASGNRNSRKKKSKSTINPNLLVKKAECIIEEDNQNVRSIEEMPIHQRLKDNLAQKGFTTPTPIQNEALEPLIAGRDMLGIANTGTGKTGAFFIPLIHRLLNSDEQFSTLVVVPTRELALQVEEEFKSMTRGLKLYASSFIGGTNISKDQNQLRKFNHVIIGTPGRLLDVKKRGWLKLQNISTLVLDEFDRMLDMGFINDIKEIVASMKRREHTMLFSATIDNTQKEMIDSLLNNPVEIKVNPGNNASNQVDQDVIRVQNGEDKFLLLLDLIHDQEFEKVLIFAETKRTADRVTKKLQKSGVKSDLIHGDKSQNYRTKALNSFKKGNLKVLVATDVAARGIDVSNITHVINYQIPLTYDSYIHRIGRTGRAGKVGKAFTFVD
jgi:ATP-dependent RNA helicase RhlE